MKTKELCLAGGCFWGLQAYLDQVDGVIRSIVGYANGMIDSPTYELVCQGSSGYAEAVYVTYDPQRLSLTRLLSLYFEVIDPTSHQRQGNDIGDQYRTGIYPIDINDLPIIQTALQELALHYQASIAIQCVPLQNFYPAEAYHQDYLKKHPNGYCHIPKSKLNSVKAQQLQKPSQEELKTTLTKEQYEVTQHKATEPPFQNAYWNQFQKGIYVDITTGEPLFMSSDKFDSGCGWPSFSKPIKSSLLKTIIDQSHGMIRTEVTSAHSDAHLGHVFEDGPKEQGGLRYCINSASLRFIAYEEMKEQGYEAYMSLFE